MDEKTKAEFEALRKALSRKALSVASELSYKHPTKENLKAYNAAYDNLQQWLHDNSEPMTEEEYTLYMEGKL